MKKRPSVQAKPSSHIDSSQLQADYEKSPNRFKDTYNFEQKIKAESEKSVHGDSQNRSDGWMNVLTGLGVCGRDKKQSTFYQMNNIFNVAELDMMYRSDGVLKLIIDLFAQEMIRQGWELEGDAEGKIIGKLEELKCNEAMISLIKWARLFGGAICIMGIEDGLPLDQPVDEAGLRNVQWLRVFDRYQAYSRDGTFESDLNSPNYGYPNVYTVNDNRTGAVFFVHYSRILRMDWNIMPPRWQNYNQGWGDSAVQTFYEDLRNYSSSFSATATIFQDFVNSVLYIPNLTAKIASQCGENQILQRLNILNLAKSVTNTAILDSDEKYEKITTNVSGLSDLLDRFMLALSAVSRIPVSLLFGRSAAGLKSTGDNDVRNFYDAVKQDQESKLRGVLEKLIRYIMISKDGPFNGKEPDNWSLQFIPLWQNTEEQNAVIHKLVAETDSMYIDRNVLDPSEVAISRFGGNKWSMNTEIDLEARERESQNPEELKELEAEKEKLYEAQPTEGPDSIATGLRGTYQRV